jgi:hypothetical protein
VRSAFQPQLNEFANFEQDMKDAEQKMYWRVFSPKSIISEKIELHIAHPSAGIIQVV